MSLKSLNSQSQTALSAKTASTVQEEYPPYNVIRIIEKKQKSIAAESTQGNETFGLFVGSKSSGKSTIINKWLERNEQTSPTVAIEYSFARKNKAISSGKDIVHIWEFSGDDLSKWIDIPITDSNLQDSFIVVCCDLSDPVEAFKTAFNLFSQVHQYLDTRLDSLEKRGSKRPKALRSNALKRGWSNHPDLACIKPCPINIALFALKQDKLSQLGDANTQKFVLSCMRWIAHSFGASLVFISSQNDAGMQFGKRLLNQYAFRIPVKVQIPGNDIVFMPAAADAFSEMNFSPQLSAMMQRGPLRAYNDLLDTLVQKSTISNNSKTTNIVYPELLKFPEDAIDSLIADVKLSLITK